jgi:hypothetical protein
VRSTIRCDASVQRWAQPFRATAAIAMLVLAIAGAAAAMWGFERRDLVAS